MKYHTIIVLDDSGSMTGEPFNNALKGAKSFA
jgi:uncharacterized protein with von Willebrand factor type A (vWA) domain